MGLSLPPFHRRLLEAVRDVCDEYGLCLAGGYAMMAHGLVERPSDDIDLATGHPLPAEELAGRVAERYRNAGFAVEGRPGGARFARLLIVDPRTGERCPVDLMTMTPRVSPVVVDSWPVLGFDDAIGLKMRAVHDRGVARDLIDVASLAGQYGFERLEWLCRSHESDFSLGRLASRLEAAELRDDAEFEAYGLTLEEVRRVKRFAAEWAQDINLRLMEEEEVDLEL